jgi:hypothetical protein
MPKLFRMLAKLLHLFFFLPHPRLLAKLAAAPGLIPRQLAMARDFAFGGFRPAKRAVNVPMAGMTDQVALLDLVPERGFRLERHLCHVARPGCRVAVMEFELVRRAAALATAAFERAGALHEILVVLR